jgi:putative addiction module killer protein
MEYIYKIVILETSSKRRPFEKWFNDLDGQTQRIIALRFDRIGLGNFGDYKLLDNGVWELRIHVGPGYRVYFGKNGNTIVVIILGGLKKTQQKDIEQAIRYWESYKGKK